MAALNAGRALVQACKRGSLVDVKTCTSRILAISNMQEKNPPIKMAMGAAAYAGHANCLRHVMASLPMEHWQGCSGPWNPFVPYPLVGVPPEWNDAVMSDYVVWVAGAGGAPDVMQALIDFGLALDHYVERIGSPLGIAIIHRKLDLIRFLLSNGADPNSYYGFPIITLLNKAASLGSRAIIQLLLDHGAVLQGSLALQGAAQEGCIEAAELLINSGADVNELLRWDMSDRDIDIIGSVLHVAVEHNQEAMVEFLLRRGARQHLLDGDKTTVKALAAKKGNPRIIRLLEKHKAGYPGDLGDDLGGRV